jgi:hypothetical protein
MQMHDAGWDVESALVVGSCLLAVAAVGVWAHAGSGIRVIAPTVHDTVVAVFRSQPMTRVQTMRALQQRGLVSLCQWRAAAEARAPGEVCELPGDRLGACLAAAAALLATIAARNTRLKSQAEDARFRGTIERLVRAQAGEQDLEGAR